MILLYFVLWLIGAFLFGSLRFRNEAEQLTWPLYDNSYRDIRYNATWFGLLWPIAIPLNILLNLYKAYGRVIEDFGKPAPPQPTEAQLRAIEDQKIAEETKRIKHIEWLAEKRKQYADLNTVTKKKNKKKKK